MSPYRVIVRMAGFACDRIFAAVYALAAKEAARWLAITHRLLTQCRGFNGGAWRLRCLASGADFRLHPRMAAAKPSSLVDTRVVYCGDNLDQLRKLPAACVDLIYIDPARPSTNRRHSLPPPRPFNSNRDYEVFWGETKEKRAFEDWPRRRRGIEVDGGWARESTRAYIDYMRPRCLELARVLKKTGSFYYHCDWHASHYVNSTNAETNVRQKTRC